MPRNSPRSERTPMPSVQLELGRYVTLRKRADGTCRVFFQVPERLRPRDWPSLIPLPVHGERRGDLSDASEVRRIQEDAKALYVDLQQARLGRAKAEGRTVKVLIRSLESSSAWKGNKPRTWKHYSTYLNHIRLWSETCDPPNPDPTKLTRAEVEGLLSLFDAQPATKKHVRKTMRLVMDQAVALNWRADNPCNGIRLKRGKTTKAGVWEQADVDAYVAAAESREFASIAMMILMEWEIGQRLGDARVFRPGAEYDREAGMFRFYQEKTDAYVTLGASEKLRHLLNAAADGELMLFRNENTGKGYTEERLSKTFAWVRRAAMKAGARYLQLRWLRHSCVVHLARSECTVPEIAAVTGHSIASVTTILSVYLPRDNEVARSAQRKRGLV